MAKRKAIPNKNLCVACGVCALQCPFNAIDIYKGCYANVDSKKCVGCGLCFKACPANAIFMTALNPEVANGN